MKSIYKDSGRMRCWTVQQDFISTSSPALPLLQLVALNSQCCKQHCSALLHKGETTQYGWETFPVLGYLYSSNPPLLTCSWRRQQTCSSKGSWAHSASILIFKPAQRKEASRQFMFSTANLPSHAVYYDLIISTFMEHLGLSAIRKVLGLC